MNFTYKKPDTLQQQLIQPTFYDLLRFIPVYIFTLSSIYFLRNYNDLLILFTYGRTAL